MDLSRRLAIATAWVLLLHVVPAQTQEKDPPAGAETPAAETEEPTDALNRETPASSIQGFLLAAEEPDYTRAADYLDLRNLPRSIRNTQPERLAEMLAIVIERQIWLDLDEISDRPAGKSGDGLPEYRDELGVIADDDVEYQLLMQRIPDGDGGHVWKISNATVAITGELYQRFGYGRITEAFAKALPDIAFLGIDLFKIVLVLALGLVLYPIVALIGLALARLVSDPESTLFPRVRKFFLVSVPVVTVLIAMHHTLVNLGLGITGQRIAQAQTLTTVAVVWLLLVGSGLVRDGYGNRLRSQGREGALVLLRPATSVLRIFIVIVAILVWLDNAGFNITTLLAGLGVGGVAMALALQKPLEDVFGALTLYTQQPVRIGDFCRIGAQTGTIEEIGLRTTRLRTLANTLISVPNHRLAAEPIDNISARSKILYSPTLRLRVDSSEEQVSGVLAGIRSLLESHEKVISDGARVRFQTIGTDALELNIFAYIDVKVWADFLAVAEELNMKILGIVSDAGTTLALPGTRLHMEGIPASNPSPPD